jgi:hypothetical protein
MGFHNVCSGMYKGSEVIPLHVFLIDNSAGPLCWSFLDDVGLLMLYCMSNYTANNEYMFKTWWTL